jgi:hypothetical protein
MKFSWFKKKKNHCAGQKKHMAGHMLHAKLVVVRTLTPAMRRMLQLLPTS